MMIKRKIIIFGGSGFIGTETCKKFHLSSLEFKIVDKNRSRLFNKNCLIADVRDYQLSKKINYRATAIVNLAAEHKDNVIPRSLYDDVNVIGANNVCDFAKKRKINTLVFTSSVAIYGFAKLGTDELGKIAPFNDYGRTKWEAESIYKAWQAEDPKNRILVIIRPTVVFGERNRGNVFNLLKQIASGNFVMVGDGKNRKSMAYVENVAAFIEYSLNFKPGIHIYNYIDKPDFTMNELVARVNRILGRSEKITFRLSYIFGLVIGKFFDLIAFVTRKKLAISSIRVKKFCANSVYGSAISKTGFVPPVNLIDAIERTVKYEFLEDHKKDPVYFSE
jgi:nucleoside-diphosphate-sugar epimerase